MIKIANTKYGIKKDSRYNIYCLVAPPTGLEPVTSWLTVMRSTDWAMEEYIAKHPIGCIALSWHLPIFPGRHQPSIFGTTELNFCVRYGNRWTLSVINTNYFTVIYMLKLFALFTLFGDSCGNRTRVAGVRGRSLNRLTNEPCFDIQGTQQSSPLRITWCTIRGSNPGHPD